LQTADAYIPGTVDALLHPEAPLALRLSGQLLLGVVRLFSRKVTFLHQVCIADDMQLLLCPYLFC
jgi:cohesin complex subunit SCC1